MAEETTEIDIGVLKELKSCIDRLMALLLEQQSIGIDGVVSTLPGLPYNIDIRVSKEDWSWRTSKSVAMQGYVQSGRKDFSRNTLGDRRKGSSLPCVSVNIVQTTTPFMMKFLKSWIARVIGFGFLVCLMWMISLFLVGRAIPFNEYEIRHSESRQTTVMTNKVAKAESSEELKIKAVCDVFK